ADLVVVNTCAVREKSEEKLSSYLGRLEPIKRKKPVRIAVIGCVAKIRGRELLEKQAVVDYVLGPDNAARLPALARETEPRKFVSTSGSKEWQEIPPEIILHQSPVSAFVTVMEGCDNFCAYCIVPYARGREKYRPFSSILGEAGDLARKGYVEIQLLGQNVNSYRDPDSGRSFTDLLSAVTGVDGLRWIRFLTSHPKNFRPETAEVMAAHETICKQLHLPLQSGSSAVLERMKRGYSRGDYLDIVSSVRRLMPDISLSTDIIAGFPGESEKDFEETLTAIREVRFTNIFSFRYSPRPRTAAAKLGDPVPEEEKRRRLEEIQRLQKSIQLENHARQVGRTMTVLCPGRARKTPDLFTGRNEGHQVVNFQSDQDCTSRFVDVRITGFGPYSLLGEHVPNR
ncbi:MAG: tRNA (N6-isopentenyl adenosine(37)-C2)-methylthiotransferase MiaB, partial [Candidatus Aminicenantes bacterium]|nr:tRNA (N6-isopentenyl adenosine(37)-C2)-methylthiotransferase MiaB [Candidatus Aminicenantes bacterium]